MTENLVKLSDAYKGITEIYESGIEEEIIIDKLVDYMIKNRISSLNNYTWEEIAEFCFDGSAPDRFDLGDTKLISIDDAVYNVAIYAFNRDDIYYDENSSSSEERDYYQKYNGGSYKACITFGLKEVYLPKLQFEGFDKNNNSFENTLLHSTIENYIFNRLEPEMVEVMKLIKRTYPSSKEEGKCRIYLPTEKEITGVNEFAINESLEQFDYFKNMPSRLVKYKIDNKVGTYWTSSTSKRNTSSFVYINNKGKANHATAMTVSNGVSFNFCV